MTCQNQHGYVMDDMMSEQTERVVDEQIVDGGLGCVDVLVADHGVIVVPHELAVQGVEVHQNGCIIIN